MLSPADGSHDRKLIRFHARTTNPVETGSLNLCAQRGFTLFPSRHVRLVLQIGYSFATKEYK